MPSGRWCVARRIADDAHSALQHTQDALGEAEHTVQDVREAMEIRGMSSAGDRPPFSARNGTAGTRPRDRRVFGILVLGDRRGIVGVHGEVPARSRL